MAGNCSVCGQWLDDIESATVPQDKCWDHKGSADYTHSLTEER